MNYSNSQYSPASSSTPSIVSKTNYQFTKSPLVLFAIVAYTIYTAIAMIQSLPNLEYLDECFDALEVSPLLAVVLFCALILFVAPIIITVGLWNMYNSGGSNGASTVCSGIRTYITLFLTTFICALLFVFIEYDAMEYMDDFLEESFLPIAYITFSMIAISSMCNFALAVESTAVRRKANVDGVSRAGVLMLVFCVLSLLVYLEAIDELNVSSELIGSFDTSDESLVDLANICHIAAYVMFGIAALNYSTVMTQASVADINRQRQEAAQAAPNPTTANTGATWKCVCGRVHPSYCTTCVCGASKPRPAAPQPAPQPVPQPAPAAPVPEAEPAAPAPSHIFCSECGAKCSATAKFCRTCGHKLNE